MTSTYHLRLHTLRHAVSQVDTGKYELVELIYKNRKIYIVINEYDVLPTVINNIIYEYTHTIIILRCYAYDLDYGLIKLNFGYCDSYFSINVHESLLSVNCENSKIINGYGNNYESTIPLLNKYMETYYRTKKYIDCESSDIPGAIFFNNYNYINLLFGYSSHTIIIHNHRRFKHLIVIIKCIINGLKKLTI